MFASNAYAHVIIYELLGMVAIVFDDDRKYWRPLSNVTEKYLWWKDLQTECLTRFFQTTFVEYWQSQGLSQLLSMVPFQVEIGLLWQTSTFQNYFCGMLAFFFMIL